MRNEMKNRTERARGFSLPEVLVAVAMVGVLSAVVLPTVLGQMGKTEVSRIVQDLQAVEQGAQVFRADVGKWPGDLEHMVEAIINTEQSADALTYTDAEVTLWRGPYVSRTSVGSAGFDTGGGATIARAIVGPSSTTSPITPSPNRFLYFTVNDATEAVALQVNMEIDGPETGQVEREAGRIRWASPYGGGFYFFPLPFK